MKAFRQPTSNTLSNAAALLPNGNPPILTFEEWHHASCREHSITHLTTAVPARFRAQLSTRRLGRFVEGFERIETTESVGVERDRRAIEKDREHPFVLFAVLAGEVAFEQGSRSLRAAAGDVFLYDQGLPFSMALRRTRRLAFQVPRDAIGVAIGDPAGLVARLPDPLTTSTKLARSMLEHLAFAPAIGSVEVREHLAQTVLHLFSAGFADDLVHSRDTLLGAIKAWMRARSDDPDLDIEAVSRAFGISCRTVSRLFAADGTTPMRWLWRERLTAAHEALGRRGAPRVSDVAAANGFSDMAHFSRAFRQAFGHPPSAVRSGAVFGEDEG